MTGITGFFLGSIVGSEVTAAAIGLKAGVRRDPFAMLPFCGYNMAGYFSHWIKIGSAAPDQSKLPKIFNVNWFRKDENNKFLWPGYGENIRVLKWIFERLDGTAEAAETYIGYVPKNGTLDVSGLSITPDKLDELFKVNKNEWQAEFELIVEHYNRFGHTLPVELKTQLEKLKTRLQ